MYLVPYLVACLIPLALWILISGLDDLFIGCVFLFSRRKPFPWPSKVDLDTAPQGRIAILVPLWHEHRVIQQMLEHNLAALRYSEYDLFVGVYPNDEETARAVETVALFHPRVHLVVGPHNGPTSKGDCLNWIYRGIVDFEAREGVRFEILMTHDAEDMADPESLRLVNWFSREYAMVQVPVLALPTPFREMTHGLYCDEFAEFQTKDIPVRQFLGGFLPANGVGTGFSRTALEHLASGRGGQIFDPDCLTEDYENGFQLHALGYRQVFLPIRFQGGKPMATREYFPRNFRSATRQRSRWVAGIVLQSWQHHGWRVPWRQLYWFWRDRKGLVGNLLSPLANLMFVAGLSGAGSGVRALVPLWISHLCAATCGISLSQIAMRTWATAQIYGWRFAAGVPLRTVWGNAINFRATVAALSQFTSARIRNRTMAWRKTEHVYPRPRLGELLLRMHVLPLGEIEDAALDVPKGMRLGEYLVRSRKLTEECLYQALSLQGGIPAGSMTPHDVDRMATRSLPAEASRRCRVLPYRVEQGHLHVATPDLPSAELTRELAGLSKLEIRYRLVPPRAFNELLSEYLPPAAA